LETTGIKAVGFITLNTECIYFPRDEAETDVSSFDLEGNDGTKLKKTKGSQVDAKTVLIAFSLVGAVIVFLILLISLLKFGKNRAKISQDTRQGV